MDIQFQSEKIEEQEENHSVQIFLQQEEIYKVFKLFKNKKHYKVKLRFHHLIIFTEIKDSQLGYKSKKGTNFYLIDIINQLK